MKTDIVRYIPTLWQDQALTLYYQSLRHTLAPLFGNEEQALSLFRSSIQAENGLIALRNREVVGVLGMQHRASGFIQPSISGYIKSFGLKLGLKRCLLGWLINHNTQSNELYLDGVAVDPRYRGQGIGKALIAKFEQYAQSKGYTRVSLDVVNTNPGAKKLYQTLGYRTYKTTSMAPLQCFSFSHCDLMTKDLKETKCAGY